MEIREENLNDALVLHVVGDVDASTAADLKHHFEGALGRHHGVFVVDLSEVGFIDSSGLGALVGFYKQVRIGEGDARLCGLQEGVAKIFELTRLDRVFGIHPDVDAAVVAKTR